MNNTFKKIINKFDFYRIKIRNELLFTVDRLISLSIIQWIRSKNIIKKNEDSAKKQVLFCCYKITPGTANESVEVETLESTLRQYKAGTYQVTTLYWDELGGSYFPSLRFFRAVASLNPEYLILSSYNGANHRHPSLSVLSILAKREIKIYKLWWDSCVKKVTQAIARIDPCVIKHIFLDNPTLNISFSQKELNKNPGIEKKLIGLFYPFVYTETSQVKDIDVCFLGKIDSYRSVRGRFLKVLKNNNFNIFLPDKNKKYSNVQYQDILNRSKIGINFSMSVDKHQLKARVFETIRAGALLLEERNNQTDSLLVEGEHFIGFSNPEELLEQIELYLSNEKIRLEIIAKAYAKVSNDLNGDIFWNRVFD